MNVRDWIPVEDHCSGIIAALFEGKAGNAYNFGGNSEMVNIEVVKLILDKLDKSHSLISYVTDRLGHDRRHAIDSSFAERELKWKPLHNFREGLESTIDWYLQNRDCWGAAPRPRRKILRPTPLPTQLGFLRRHRAESSLRVSTIYNKAMPEPITLYRVFLGAPSDVTDKLLVVEGRLRD